MLMFVKQTRLSRCLCHGYAAAAIVAVVLRHRSSEVSSAEELMILRDTGRSSSTTSWQFIFELVAKITSSKVKLKQLIFRLKVTN